jgi:hypothetical protein
MIPVPKGLTTHRIEIHLNELSQLFNSMDPSPFHEKDLDDDAEEFIVSWAQEYPVRDPIILLIFSEPISARHRSSKVGRKSHS